MLMDFIIVAIPVYFIYKMTVSNREYKAYIAQPQVNEKFASNLKKIYRVNLIGFSVTATLCLHHFGWDIWKPVFDYLGLTR